MELNTMSANSDEPEVLFQWSARKLNPIILLYVAAVFVVFILVAYFVLRSMSAVKALAIAAVASVVPLVPVVTSRVEYRLNERVLERRPQTDKQPKEFETVFQTDELSHVVPMRHGFKFYRPLNESNPFLRFWKAHVSDKFSGEVHVEKADRERVLGVLSDLGVPNS